MCGISGLVLREGERVERSLLEKMTNAIESRGPDASGYELDENIGLGHRRLKIIDLSDAANQPMSAADGKLSIVFNGEIYNFRELRAELEREGSFFRTRSDTEVIVQAFERWGTESFRRFNGIFAFAIVDRRGSAPITYLVRDRLGVKPLFYSVSLGRLAFASTLKPLLALDWVSRAIDPDTLFAYLKFSHVPCPRSIVRGAAQLQPGTFLRFDGTEPTLEMFWDPLEAARSEKKKRLSSGHWVEDFEATLKRVVSRQLVSDVPVGCFLSGGIDSSLLTMAYTAVAKERIKTFSIGYKESEFDETPFARIVAEHFKTEHFEIIAQPKDFFELIPQVPHHYDQPFADPTLLSTLLLMRFARQHVTVGLSGDGGDELFFGYTYQQMLYHLGALRFVPRALRSTALGTVESMIDTLPKELGGLKKQQLRKLVEILQFGDEAEMFQYFIGTVGPMRLDRLSELLVERPSLSPPFFAPMMKDIRKLPFEKRIEQVFLRTFLLDTVLAKTDRASMAYGLEARVPFLDDEMVAFAASVPFDLKYRRGTKKYLLRELLSRKLPESISGRRKQGFSIPLREWLRGELKYLLDEHLDETLIRRDGIFDAEQVSGLVQAHLSGAANHSHLLWSLICFQMWKGAHL